MSFVNSRTMHRGRQASVGSGNASYKHFMRRAIGVAGSVCLASSPLHAQTTGTDAVENAQTAALASDDSNRIEEVTVTAERHKTNLQQTPIALATITPAQIAQQNLLSSRDLAGRLPGVNIPRAGITPLTQVFIIRGIGESDPIFDPAIAQYVDDVYLPRAINGLTDLVDLERVEVLRGPQGTLYGRNSAAGAIRYITADPTDEQQLRLDAGFGTYGAFATHALISGPIIEGRLQASLTFAHNQHDGYTHDPTIQRDVNDQDTNSARLKIHAHPTDDLDVQLSLDGVKDESASDYYTPMKPIIGGTFLAPIYGPFQNNTSFASQIPQNNSQEGGVSLRVADTLNQHLTVKSISAFRFFQQAPINYNNDGEPLVPYSATNPALVSISDNYIHYHDHEYTQEFQLLGQYQDVDFSSGLFFLYENFSSDRIGYVNTTPATAAGALPNYAQDQVGDTKTLSGAAYGQVNYHINDRLTATVGLRYTVEHRDFGFQGILDDFNGNPITLPAVSKAPNFLGLKSEAFTYHGNKSWYSLTPKYGISYQWTPDIFQYATISKGFRSGGYNNRAVSLFTAQPYAPETVTTYETGVKTEWLDHRARVNTSLFYNEYDALQQTVYAVNPLTNSPTSFRANAGSAHTEGLELETTIQPIDGLVWQNNASYLLAIYDSFQNAGAAGAVATGNQLPLSPRWSLYTSLSYALPLHIPGAIQLGVSATYQTKSYTDVFNTWQGEIPSQAFVDAFASYTSEDEHWTGTISAHNLANNIVYQSLQFAKGTLVWEGPQSAPRTVFVKIAYRL